MILKKQRENDQGVKRQCPGQNNYEDKMTCSIKENCCSFPWFWRNSVCKSSRKLCCLTLRHFRYERITRVKRMWRMIHSQRRIRIQLNMLRVQRRNSSSGGVYHKSGAPEGTVRRSWRGGAWWNFVLARSAKNTWVYWVGHKVHSGLWKTANQLFDQPNRMNVKVKEMAVSSGVCLHLHLGIGDG